MGFRFRWASCDPAFRKMDVGGKVAELESSQGTFDQSGRRPTCCCSYALASRFHAANVIASSHNLMTVAWT